MAANIRDVRRMALALPGVEEGVCHGTPAFYVRKRLMLRLAKLIEESWGRLASKRQLAALVESKSEK